MAFDGKGSIAIMTGKKLDLSQIHLAFAWTYASETWIFDNFVMYFQQIWSRRQKFPPQESKIVQKLVLSALVSIKKLITQSFISFQKSVSFFGFTTWQLSTSPVFLAFVLFAMILIFLLAREKNKSTKVITEKTMDWKCKSTIIKNKITQSLFQPVFLSVCHFSFYSKTKSTVLKCPKIAGANSLFFKIVGAKAPIASVLNTPLDYVRIVNSYLRALISATLFHASCSGM